ncbi:MAG: lipoprotein signal peptidase [Muribaculaceae bacterium]|nr:lipoprotein signal peptidase [Muribaculaceae bacterium]
MRAGQGKTLVLLASIIIAVVVIADQWLKIWIKTHFYFGEDMEIFSWFHLKFIENNGFAFGLEWFNKYVLTFGRIAAVILFIWALRKIVKELPGIGKGFIIAFALIIAGAAGNIFDCVFYGEIFNNPYPPEVAQIFPVGGGYAGWFEGRVVDMLYFPLFSFHIPDCLPLIGGRDYEFFQYIFNIADAAITVGVLMILIFYRNQASEALNLLFGTSDSQSKTEK